MPTPLKRYAKIYKGKSGCSGMIQRSEQVVIRMLANVRQQTIKSLITQHIAPKTQVYTDEYNICARLVEWGYRHKTVNHSTGEYARDEEGDGFMRCMW